MTNIPYESHVLETNNICHSFIINEPFQELENVIMETHNHRHSDI